MVNDISTESDVYTTRRLAGTAHGKGHELYHNAVGDFAYALDATTMVRGTLVPGGNYSSSASFLKALRGERTPTQRMAPSDRDVVTSRSNPAEDALELPWAFRASCCPAAALCTSASSC